MRIHASTDSRPHGRAAGKRLLRQPRVQVDAVSTANRLWEAIDTPISLSCYLLAKAGQWSDLVRKSVDPSGYLDPLGFFCDYQAVKFLSKFPELDTGIDTAAVGREKFDQAEARCKQTNHRFRDRVEGRVFLPHVERVLSTAQRKISQIMGPVPSFERLEFEFGPGASYGVRGETSAYNKVEAHLECTYAFAGVAESFLSEFPGWINERHPSWVPETDRASVKLVPGSQLSFVPKDAKTDRPICIEPLLNGLAQKGYGTWLRRRLSRYGINLDDQGVNQRLAGEALHRGLATMDFSSASDTIAHALVLDLLPIDWFEALDVVRSPCYTDGTRWRTFQKFSSMGNAYTFELETLLFYAIACGCCEELGIPYETGVSLNVYGDDVIIPQASSDLFQEVAEVCGFELNREKSFTGGQFYESCGHDFFIGHQVRPFLLKKRIKTLKDAFYAINTVRRIRERARALPTFSESNQARVLLGLGRLHSWMVHRVPEKLRYQGPEGFGDGHIVVDWDEATPVRHPTLTGWCFRSLVDTVVRRMPPTRGDDGLLEWPVAYALYEGARRSGSVADTGRALDYSKVEALELPPLALHSAEGYVVRNNTRSTLQRLLTPDMGWDSGRCWFPGKTGFLEAVRPRVDQV